MHKIQEKLLQIAANPPKGKITLRFLGEMVGEPNNPQKIKHHLDQLTKIGSLIVHKKDGKIEKMELAKTGVNKNNLFTIPIYGAANCGVATRFADNQVEGYLKISKSLVKSSSKKLFAVRAVGNSMNRAAVGNNKVSIEEGDYVIADGHETLPKSGDYVISTIDETANIKRFMLDKSNKQVVLVSESTKDYPPIIIDIRDADAYVVNGKVVQVIKKPKF